MESHPEHTSLFDLAMALLEVMDVAIPAAGAWLTAVCRCGAVKFALGIQQIIPGCHI